MLFYRVSVRYTNNTRMIVYNSFSCIKDLLNKYVKNKAVKNVEINTMTDQSKETVHNVPATPQHIDEDERDAIGYEDSMNYEYPGYMFY